MKGTTFSILVGVTFISLAGGLLLGWYLQLPAVGVVPSYFNALFTTMFGLLLSGLILLIWGLSYRLKDQIALKESEDKFRVAFDSAAIGMALISLKWCCLKVNSSLCQILGFSEEELTQMDFQRIVHADDFCKNLPDIKKIMEGTIAVHQSEQRYLTKNGDMIWMMVSLSLVRDATAKPRYFIAQFQNISAYKCAEEKLRFMAYHDALTGLANRNQLEQYVKERLYFADRSSQNFALIFLDLDHFKNINDTLGHDAGDILLQIIAERIKSTVRDTDIVSRPGGDEFVVLISDVIDVADITVVVKKILNCFADAVSIHNQEFYITTSIGISVFPFDGEDIQTLMKNADLALYYAKDQGRNNYQFCTKAISAAAKDNLIRHPLPAPLTDKIR